MFCPYGKENMVNKIGIVIVGATLVVAHCLIGGLAFCRQLYARWQALPAGVRQR